MCIVSEQRNREPSRKRKPRKKTEPHMQVVTTHTHTHTPEGWWKRREERPSARCWWTIRQRGTGGERCPAITHSHTQSIGTQATYKHARADDVKRTPVPTTQAVFVIDEPHTAVRMEEEETGEPGEDTADHTPAADLRTRETHTHIHSHIHTHAHTDTYIHTQGEINTKAEQWERRGYARRKRYTDMDWKGNT